MITVKLLRIQLLLLSVGILFSELISAQTSTPFTFTLPSAAATSAGVFSKDGTLLKTLWSGVNYSAGAHTVTWDGTLDDATLATPGTYDIRVLSNNVQYHWDGVIGNTSDAVTGPTVQRFFERMYAMASSGNSVYFATGYNEGSPSQAKFLTTNPQVKIDVMPFSGTGQSTLYMTTDGTRVYYGGSDAFSPGNSNWFVYATNTSNDLETAFSNGTNLQCVYGPLYHSAIDVISNAAANVSGMAVQKSGNYLFVSHKNLNEIHVLDKNTGALVRKISVPAPAGLATDNSNTLWAIVGFNGNPTLQKFTIQNDGSLSAPVMSPSGLVDPLAMAVSPDNNTLLVADAGASQQLKAYDNASGNPAWTFGQAGGYLSNPNVTNDKFYFSDLSGGIHETFLAYQPDGSFWVGDIGNYRALHFSASRTYLDRMMFLRHNYSIAADPNAPSRVFAEYLEFNIDYTKPLAANNGSWTLAKNWRAAVPPAYWQEFMVNILKFVTTFSNGRTYAFLQNLSTWRYELVELPPAGPIRFTGFTTDAAIQILSDGSLAKYAIAGLARPAYWQKFPLRGFDGNNNPLWTMGAGDTLATTPIITGEDPVDWGSLPMAGAVTSSNIVVSFDKDVIQNGHGYGYHLGGIRAGDNKWLWRTAKSTTPSYAGAFPADGSFDVGNTVQYPGGVAVAKGRNIFWDYHGEFWKSSQVNKWNQVYDDGLFIGQFGVTGPEVVGQIAAPMMAGNVFSANLVEDANGDLYLYHNDESHHAAMHRWKITGLNSIQEQTVPVTIAAYASGLLGQYYDNNQLNNFDVKKRRVDAQVNNNPVPAEIRNTNAYSVRWTGYVLPAFTENYTFYANTNKGVKLWVDDQLVINNWGNNGQTESQGNIPLQGGRKYSIRLDNNGTNESLSWSSTSQAKQVIPSSSLVPGNLPDTTAGTDLMEGLPFNEVLLNNLYGWSRNSASEDYTGPQYIQWWSVKSGTKSYVKNQPADLVANYTQNNGNYTVNRDLGTNNALTSWKVSGSINYEGNNANSSADQGGFYLEVLDNAGKILTRFYTTLYWNNSLSYLSATANKTVLAADKSEIIGPVMNTAQPITITVNNGNIVFNYANFAPVTTSIFDATGNWRAPKTLRLNFYTSGSNYSRSVDLQNLKFSKSGEFSLLPLDFLAINAQGVEKDVNVSWTTDNEVNTSSVQLERSNDGQTFRYIANINLKNIPGQQQYSYLDKEPPGGILYYRLKLVNKDGSVKYSPVAAVNRKESRFSVYPNPVKDRLLVTHPAAGISGSLELITATGNRERTIPLNKNASSTYISTGALPAGFYFVRFRNDNTVITTAFIKQ